MAVLDKTVPRGYLEWKSLTAMPLPDKIAALVYGLPDGPAAERFFRELLEKFPSEASVALANDALLSDVLTLAAFSPLLAATLLHNPAYIPWLERERRDIRVRDRDALLESLARFALTASDIETDVMLARFRRRELLRIYLRDIRRLATMAEITEELSNLADAVLEFALREARRELDNRFGQPLETDEKGRQRLARFCIVALGKLGSRELNYSSDIDLLFIYSADGTTSGRGTRSVVTNREYFVKLAEFVVRLVGRQSGEGAAFRIDMRLRPHGSIGALALSLAETVRYYRDEAREWERQVLIRSRGCAGDVEVYREFFAGVEASVFRTGSDPVESLENVRRSKQMIDASARIEKGFNVKLGRGGIREIEFIAQALQLAHGGGDPWLRFPHTLVSLSRLADRGLIRERELTELFDAYDFLRRLEHRLQMEHGLQVHSVPDDPPARRLVAARMGFDSAAGLDSALASHTGRVHGVFQRVFEHVDVPAVGVSDGGPRWEPSSPEIESSAKPVDAAYLRRFASIAPHLVRLRSFEPALSLGPAPGPEEIRVAMLSFNEAESDFGSQLAALRRAWSHMILRIAAADALAKITIAESKRLQTCLAEASVEAALAIANDELLHRVGMLADGLSVLGLGKLGGRGVDHGSDLDLVLVYDDADVPGPVSAAELHSQAVELFVSTLSGVTRDGSLYRVDLRLRPYGKNGASSNPRGAFIDYFQNSAAVWELLAFVKIRGVAGAIACEVEREVREIIHRRALAADAEELRGETIRIRYLLERQRSGKRKELDIKYGPGGMLDVYFAARYLQLRDDVRDDVDDRSTIATLARLLDAGSLSPADHDALTRGYEFLSELDHNIRLISGRSSRLPTDQKRLAVVAERMRLPDIAAVDRTLAIHRLEIRDAFERLLA